MLAKSGFPAGVRFILGKSGNIQDLNDSQLLRKEWSWHG